MRTPGFLDKFTRFFTDHPILLTVVEWSKTHSLPGLLRIPIYNLVQFILEETRKDALVTRANSMAFSFFLAIFPGIIVLISLLPYFPISLDFFGTVHRSIKQIMPGNAGTLVFGTVEDLLKTTRGDVLSVGFFLAMWFSSNGMLSMMEGLEKDYHTVFRRRNALEKRLIAIQLTFTLSFILFASAVLVVLGNTILNFVFKYIEVDFLTKMVFFFFRWIVVVLLFYTGISAIYRLGAPTRKKIPFINSGAVLATILSILTSWGFSFYVDNFGNFNKIYGAIGSLIVLMVWIQINCVILLIGFELNAGIAVIRDSRRREASDEGA